MFREPSTPLWNSWREGSQDGKSKKRKLSDNAEQEAAQRPYKKASTSKDTDSSLVRSNKRKFDNEKSNDQEPVNKIQKITDSSTDDGTLAPLQKVNEQTPSNENCDEWESTISMPISEDVYREFVRNSDTRLDVIFLFKCGARLSGRRFQRKTTVTCRYLLSFENKHWYPIERTTAVEQLTFIPDMSTITKTIFRRLYFVSENIRISFNCETTLDGVKYNVEYEVEYPPGSEYEYILDLERQLMSHVKVFVQRKKMTLEKIFSCVMSKVQMWHVFDPSKDYIWAYKWNGVKSKILITDTIVEMNGVTGNLTYIWPDVNDISTKICSISPTAKRKIDISPLLNLCFLVEIMDHAYVVIEAVGALIDTVIFTTEPKTNVAVLAYLRRVIGNHGLLIDGIPLRFQRFYKQPMPNRYGKNHDGFIIIQNEMIIKWKIPTVDVKCIGPYLYSVADETLQLDKEGVVGCIYELCYGNKILRKRIDRIAASSKNEWTIYVKSNEHLVCDADSCFDYDDASDEYCINAKPSYDQQALPVDCDPEFMNQYDSILYFLQDLAVEAQDGENLLKSVAKLNTNAVTCY